MSESGTSLQVQIFVSILQLTLIVGLCWWFTRDDRKVFRMWRVLVVSLCAALLSSCIAAAWWWFAPQEVGKHSPFLLAAAFLPIFALLAWGVLLSFRQKDAKKRDERI